ncbi:MAG: hypothetical protein K6T85_02310 [Gorillibacterium sp.]|nr:hypothetical protein [Gorillibacterium sp.]
MYEPDKQIPNFPNLSDFPATEPRKLKSTAGAVLFAIFLPGTGHFYLGLMKRGLTFMLGVILNIVLITSIVTNQFSFSSPKLFVPAVTFASLLLPVMYVYHIFDAAQRAKLINSNRDNPFWDYTFDELPIKPPILGGILVLSGAILFLYQMAPSLMAMLFKDFGGTFLALLLIGGGGWIIYRMK